MFCISLAKIYDAQLQGYGTTEFYYGLCAHNIQATDYVQTLAIYILADTLGFKLNHYATTSRKTTE